MKQLGLFNDVSQIPSIKKQISELYQQIYDIQKDCQHPAETLIKVAKSDTGNWDRGCDRYWYEFECKLCEKKWAEDQ